MRLREGKHWEDPELNLISLVDVVLMMLVFFMMTTHFIQSTSVNVQLPTAGVPPVYREAEGIEITVDAEGRYFVNQKPVPGSDPASLRQSLLAAAGDKRDQPIILRADARATHQSVVTVMDVAGAMGFAQLQILTTETQVSH